MNIPASPNASDEAPADPWSYLRVIWRWRWVVLGIVVVATLGTYLLSLAITKQYAARAQVKIQPLILESSLFNDAGQLTEDPGQSLAVAARLAVTRAVATQAAEKLRPAPSDPGSLTAETEISLDPDPGFLTIRVEDPDPQRAAAVANAMASALVEVRGARARAPLDTAISQLQQQLAGVPPSDTRGRRDLSGQIERVRSLRDAQRFGAQVVQPATVPTAAVSPRPLRNAALAFVVSLLIAIGFAFVLDRMDRRVRDPGDLATLTGTPLLADIPSGAFLYRATTPVVSEAFQMLRTGLTYFNVDRALKTILVTSPLKEEGKTTVAMNLARGMAEAGQDVILVDADLRQSQIGPRMGSAANDGLGRVLAGERDFDDVMREMDVVDGRLRILPGGVPPPNPSALISSDSMRALLARLADESDVVVLDTPPMLVVSDAIPLLGQVSGIVLVGRLGRTTRDAVRRLTEVISNTGGVLLGVVATGSKAGDGYGSEAFEAPAADAVVVKGEVPAAAAPRARRRLGVLRARR
jgi:capsular exopolysaccharide synthesis family protein